MIFFQLVHFLLPLRFFNYTDKREVKNWTTEQFSKLDIAWWIANIYINIKIDIQVIVSNDNKNNNNKAW